MALAERGGVVKQQLLEVLTGTLFDSPVYRTYGAILAEERFKPAGFAAPLALKDMRLVRQSSEALRVPMPLLSLLRDHLLQTIAQQGEDVDCPQSREPRLRMRPPSSASCGWETVRP
jgi:3-hydroxyisobutyrate dehydrogenase-like beta-hydroxyacid dehydrogenase